MARLGDCGWELDDKAEIAATDTTSNGTIAIVTSTPTPRTGTYCLKTQLTTTASGAKAYQNVPIGATITEGWWRLPIYQGFQGVVGKCVFFGVPDSSNPLIWHLEFEIDPSDGLIRVYRSQGTTGPFGGARALLGVTSQALNAAAWNRTTLHWVISDTVGAVDVLIGGTNVLSLTGQDTKNGGNGNASSFAVGIWRGATGTANDYFAFDDIAWNDTTTASDNGDPGDGSIYYLPPNAAGDVTELTRGGTDSGANWSQVDEVPPSMTDYVEDTVVDNYDLYNLAATTGTLTIQRVTAIAYALKSDTGTASLALVQKSGTTETTGATQALDTTAKYFRERNITNPATGVAYTQSEVDALQVGVKVK